MDVFSKNKLANLTDLYIFWDGTRSIFDQEVVQSVRRIAHGISVFSVRMIERDQNIGFANSIGSRPSEIF